MHGESLNMNFPLVLFSITYSLKTILYQNGKKKKENISTFICLFFITSINLYFQ